MTARYTTPLDEAAAHQIRLLFAAGTVRAVAVTCTCRLRAADANAAPRTLEPGRPDLGAYMGLPAGVADAWALYDQPANHVDDPVPFTGEERYVR